MFFGFKLDETTKIEIQCSKIILKVERSRILS